MVSSTNTQSKKILDYLKKLAPYSIIDLGLQYANSGNVIESSRTGNKVVGTVREDIPDTDNQSGDPATHNVSIDVMSSTELDALCSCCSHDEMKEQWCHHAVALLWRACELGFFDLDSGFASSESTYRLNTSSAGDIAAVIEYISKPENAVHAQAAYNPHVAVELDLSSDRLGVRILLDSEVQAPTVFEGFRRRSSRALDNVLLEVMDDEGSWDEENQVWYINSSKSIDLALGLVQEYSEVRLVSSRKRVEFSTAPLDAKLQIEWHPTSCELSMHWVLPDGRTEEKSGELIGTGPYWAVINNVIYRVSQRAARIAAIFPYSSKNIIQRSAVGPILEAVTQNLFDASTIDIINPDLQPEAQVKTPLPVLDLERRESNVEHFDSGYRVEVLATLEFQYPTPPANKNIVYLPDRSKEREHLDFLRSLGFEYHSDRKKFILAGDLALDLASNGSKIFPDEWEVHGLDAIRKGIRFAALSLNVSISSQRADRAEKKGNDWFDCHISLVQNNANVPLSTIFKHGKSDAERWIRLDSGAYARIPGGNLGGLKTTLGLLDPNFRLSNTIKSKLSVPQAISLSRVEDEQFNINVDAKLKAISTKLREFSTVTPVKISKHFHGKLRKYQNEGLTWLNFLRDFELGGILADEMGLGKTVQALALIQHVHDKYAKEPSRRGPTLVVAPTSVITNWLYEAKRFTPKLKVLLLHGPTRKSLFQEIPEHDIVITSYALLRLDRYDLERHEFLYLILDEAQNIKNSQAATTKAAKALRSRHRLALTGTPTENRPMELWSIMDFLMPGYLGSNEFFRNFIERPILEDGPGIEVTKFLNAKTRPFILRRQKAEVEKDLPPKIESVLHVEMAPSQLELYSQILEDVRPKIFEQINQKGIRGASISILAALLRLRQVCNHPNSIEALKGAPGFESGKFNLLKELLEEALASNRKILLFSQFKEMLAIIKRFLEEQGVNYLYLDGATKNRQELIDRFNNDTSVRLFLISLKAGGTGLNLTAADTVVIYDPWWNPAVESQAVDRAHRIGQTKTVSVYRLVTENSVEQKIMDLKAKKSKLVDALINENGLTTAKLTKTDLEALFTLG